jgi:hypothetical protein
LIELPETLVVVLVLLLLLVLTFELLLLLLGFLALALGRDEKTDRVVRLFLVGLEALDLAHQLFVDALEMLHLVAHHLYEPRHQASRAVGGRRGLSTSEGGCGIALTSLKLVAVRGTVGITSP